MLPLLHAAATWFMTGLIWFVQVVHYPLMRRVGSAGFVEYEAAHTRRTTLVVGPPMLVEAACPLWIAVAPPTGISPGAGWTGVLLVALIWLSTALVQVPQHTRLSAGFDAGAHRLLVGGNWFRTVLWTLRAVLAAWMVLPR